MRIWRRPLDGFLGHIGAKLGRGQDASLGGVLGSLGRPLGGLLAVVLSFPGASWGPLGGLLGPLGGFLGASWGLLGTSRGLEREMSVPVPRRSPLLELSRGPLGPSWRLLGLSWGPLGLFRGALGGLLGRVGAILGAFLAVLERR